MAVTIKSPDLIILGAGAAGLMCAITAGRRGKKVLVLDHANKIGKKILMSGGGRCNFTNLNTTHANFLSANSHFCKSALARYTPWDFTGMVLEHEIAYHEKAAGQLFCDDSSKDILAMLESECEKASVTIRSHCRIDSVEHSGAFVLKTSDGEFRSEALVVATGGLSIPKMGATGFGYQLAGQFGLNVLPTRAGLVPFTLPEKELVEWSPLSGIALDVSASVPGATFNEPMLFTHRGLSGPSMLQLSSYWQLGESVTVELLANAAGWLAEQLQQAPKRSLQNTLAAAFPKRVAETLARVALPDSLSGEVALNTLTHEQQKVLADRLESMQWKPHGTEGYRTAEVTLGGVDTDELSSKTMEAHQQSGLFFVGEVMDVTGHLGGHNFQWAWASGYAAGQAV